MSARGPTVVDEVFLAEFVERYGAAWRTLDGARIAAECTDDTVWAVPGADPPLKGRSAVSQWLDGVFRMIPDAELEYPVGPPFIGADGTCAAARWRIRGAMVGPMDPPGFAPTNRVVEDDGIEIYEEFQDGLLARCTIMFDRLHLAEQIGAAPAPGSPGERLGVLMQRLHARRARRRSET